MIAHIYEISITLNSKVNIEKLDLEIRASGLANYVTPPYLINSRLYIEFSNDISGADKTALETILATHDGVEAAISENLVNAREKKIRELTEMAIYHPLLVETDTVEYLTSIDNWFNGWKRSGVNSSLISKIAGDAASGTHPQDAFLNTVINSEGNKTFEFLIGAITS
jgi:hypothetical protein